MNRIEYLINNPNEVETNDLDLLNTEIDKYPYFYSLRALKLLALKKDNNAEFEKQLEITAAINNNKDLFFFLHAYNKEFLINNHIDKIIPSDFNAEIKSDSIIEEEIIQETIQLDNQNDFIQDSEQIQEIENNTEEEIIEETILLDNQINFIQDNEQIQEIENNTEEEIIEETIQLDNQNDFIQDGEQIQEIETNIEEEIIEETIQLDNQNDFIQDGEQIQDIESNIEEEIIEETILLDNQNDFIQDNEQNNDLESILESVEHSIKITNELSQHLEIVNNGIKETNYITGAIEQVDLINRSTNETTEIVSYHNSSPILAISPFLVLNPNNLVARQNQFNFNNKEKEMIQSEYISEIENEINSIPEIENNNSFSFNDWLKIPSSTLMEKEQKFQVIEEFLDKNPKIAPLKKQEIKESKIEIKEAKQSDFSDLMTETLAQIYIEQKQYEKAIKAYKILILKYPEKNSLFANQIKEIENLKNSK